MTQELALSSKPVSTEFFLKKKPKAQEQKKEVKEKPKSDYSKRLSFKEQREFDELEKQIPLLEEKKKEIEEFLNSGTNNHQELLEKSEEISKIIAELDEKELRWLELSERA